MSIYSRLSKTPMIFWAGVKIDKDEIRDVKSYNRENSFMWLSYGIFYIVMALLALIVDLKILGLIFIVTSLLSVILLIITYQRILRKYRQQ
jgi:hypothetical protein